MENQAEKYKEAILDVLLKRIVPLEQQLEAQASIITDLSQSLDSLAKMLAISHDTSIKKTEANIAKRNSLIIYEESKQKEEERERIKISNIRKAFSMGISNIIKAKENNTRAPCDPDSEHEDEIDKEEESQLIDIELSQLAEFGEDAVSDFYYSDYSLSSISALAALPELELLTRESEKPSPKVLWVLKLFWQLQSVECSDDEAWEKWSEFVKENHSKLEEAFFSLRQKFDFSMQNLDKIEVLIKNKKNLLDPGLFAFSPAASHLVAVEKNVIEFSGAISAASAMRFKRLLYKKSLE